MNCPCAWREFSGRTEPALCPESGAPKCDYHRNYIHHRYLSTCCVCVPSDLWAGATIFPSQMRHRGSERLRTCPDLTGRASGRCEGVGLSRSKARVHNHEATPFVQAAVLGGLCSDTKPADSRGSGRLSCHQHDVQGLLRFVDFSPRGGGSFVPMRQQLIENSQCCQRRWPPVSNLYSPVSA